MLRTRLQPPISRHLLAPLPAAVLALLVAAVAAPAAGQVTVDDFGDAQGPLSTAGTAASSQADTAGTILGGERDMAVSVLSGGGTVTAEVASSEMTFDSPAGTLGRLRVQWDATDSSSGLDPTGLGGADLTAGGGDALEITLSSTGAGVVLQIEVFEAAGDVSVLRRVLPAVASATTFRFPYAEFVGTANFASVGAIQLTLEGDGADVAVGSPVQTASAAVSVGATKVDALVAASDADADTVVDPGEQIEYTVEITSAGTTGTGVGFTDTLDTNSTLDGTFGVSGVDSTPVALDDSYDCLGNVGLSVPNTSGVLNNDCDPDAATGATPCDSAVGLAATPISAFDAVSSQGGAVTMPGTPDGSFTYTPPAGFEGIDTFSYTIDDDEGNADTATVFLNCQEVIWFVDGDAGSDVTGDGTLGNPFASPTPINNDGTDLDDPGDVIFVHNAVSDYNPNVAGGFTLESNQSVVGEGATGVDLATLLGLTVPPHTPALPAINGTAPTITNSIDNVVTLASGNFIAGVILDPVAGRGLIGNAVAGGTFQDFDVILNGGGNNNVGIDLIGVTGQFTFADCNVQTEMSTSNAGTAFRVDGGSATIDFDGTGTIKQNGGRLIDVQNKSGGSIDFGAEGGDSYELTLTSGAGTGINLSSNTGTFTFDSLSVTTSSGAGMVGSSTGTVNLTGASGPSTISATGGAAVDISGTTIGDGAAGAMTFESLSSASSAGSGIRLNSVTGSFTVTGDGASDPADTTRGRTTAKSGGGTLTLGSGGTISGHSGPGVSLASVSGVTLRNLTIQTPAASAVNDGKDGIDLSSASSVTLDNLLVTGHAQNHGIDGSTVSALTLQHVEVSSNATAVGTEGPDVHNVRFDNLTGTSSVDNSLFHTSRENIFSIFNTTGSATIGFDNVEVRDTTAGAPGNVGLLIDLLTSAQVNATVEDSSFLRNRARGVQFLSNSGSTNGSITVRNSVFESSFTPIDVAHQSANQTLSFDIDNNTINMDAGVLGESNAINVVLGGLSAATTLLQGCVRNNDIGDSASANSGSFEGVAILTHGQGAGTLTTRIEDNVARSIRQDSAYVALSSDHTGFLNVTLDDNDFEVNTGDFPLYGIDLTAGAAAGDTGTLRVNFAGPSRAVGEAFSKGIQVLTASGTPTIELQGYGGVDCSSGPTPAGCDATVATFLDGANACGAAPCGTSPTPADVFIFAGTVTGTVSAAGGTVPVPGNCP